MVNETIIQIDCNYHTKWQNNSKMRFVLQEVDGNRAKLGTRNTNKSFWTNLSDLIFIETPCNTRKLKDLQEGKIEITKYWKFKKVNKNNT